LINTRPDTLYTCKPEDPEAQTTKTVSFPTLLNGRYIVLLQVNVEY
jgi:hypothetical protein